MSRAWVPEKRPQNANIAYWTIILCGFENNQLKTCTISKRSKTHWDAMVHQVQIIIIKITRAEMFK